VAVVQPHGQDRAQACIDLAARLRPL